MRYLYANSEPFPLDYDFLDTLRRFLAAAARVVALDGELTALERDVESRNRDAVEVLEAFSRYVDTIERASSAALQHLGHAPAVRDYAGKLIAHTRRSADQAKVEVQARTERHNRGDFDAIDALRKAIRDAVFEFLLTARLDLAIASARFRLVDKEYRIEVTCHLADDIDVVYGVPADRVPDWLSPRKVSSFAGEVEIQIGMKKKFLRKDLTREIVRITDHTVMGAVVREERAEMQLSRKADLSRDSLALCVWRDQEGTHAEIRRPSREGDEPFPAVTDDLDKLDELWSAMRAAAEETLAQKKEVRAVRIDGDDAFQGHRVLDLIDRLVVRFAPIVAQIAARSPSPDELSLKTEDADGRREEIYLRKGDMAETLSVLDGPDLDRFARLEVFPELEVILE